MPKWLAEVRKTYGEDAQYCVIGEQNASNLGIGNLITRASADFNVPLIFAALIVLAVLGVILVVIVDLIETRTTGWAKRSGFGA